MKRFFLGLPLAVVLVAFMFGCGDDESASADECEGASPNTPCETEGVVCELFNSSCSPGEVTCTNGNWEGMGPNCPVGSSGTT